MANYSFYDVLSPIDFERFSKDVIQKREGIEFTLSKKGKDKGIDFFHNSHGIQIIGQAKNYKSYKDLIRVLKHQELPKLKILNPTRYILTTSVDLTVSQVQEILSVFRDYIKDTRDILGKHELNELLSQPDYREIEKKNSKLWISSSAVLEKLLDETVYRSQYNLVEHEINEIKDVSRFYVQNQSYEEAYDILAQNKYVIISGTAGSGKTTLARMLILRYLEEYYDLVLITQSATEAWSMFNKKRNQIFFFDDFLGSFQYDENIASGGNLNDLIRLIRNIQISENKYMVLTTREYILKKGQLHHREQLKEESVELIKCTVDASKYTRYEKAEILFNHLFHSNVDRKVFDWLSDESYSRTNRPFYDRIISHSNYSPRLIEDFTKKIYPSILSQGASSKPYSICSRLEKHLDDPYTFWEDLFERQDVSCQVILLTLFVSCEPMTVDDLKLSFENMAKVYSEEYSDLVLSNQTFKTALKVLSNSFIDTNQYRHAFEIVSFQNPSINDFLLGYLKKHRNWVPILIRGAEYWNQLTFIYSTSVDGVNFGEISEEIGYRDISGTRIKLLEDERQVLLETALRKFELARLSNIEEREFTFEFSRFSSLEEIEIVKLIDLVSLFNIKSNHGIREFVINKVETYFSKFDSNTSLPKKLVNGDSMEWFANLLQSTAEFLSRDPLDVIQKYRVSITFCHEYFGFKRLEKVYPEEFKSYYNKHIREIRKDIRSLIIEDLNYYDYEALEEDDKIDQIIDWQAQGIFDEYGMRMTEKFRKKMIDAAFDGNPQDFVRGIDHKAFEESRKKREKEQKERERQEQEIQGLFQSMSVKHEERIDGLLEFARKRRETDKDYIERILTDLMGKEFKSLDFFQGVEKIACLSFNEGIEDFTIEYLQDKMRYDSQKKLMDQIDQFNPIIIESEYHGRYRLGNNTLLCYLMASFICNMEVSRRKKFLLNDYPQMFYESLGSLGHESYWDIWQDLNPDVFYNEFVMANWDQLYSQFDFESKESLFKSLVNISQIELVVDCNIKTREMEWSSASGGVGIVSDILLILGHYDIADVPFWCFESDTYLPTEDSQGDSYFRGPEPYQNLIDYFIPNFQLPSKNDTTVSFEVSFPKQIYSSEFMSLMAKLGMFDTIENSVRDTDLFIKGFSNKTF